MHAVRDLDRIIRRRHLLKHPFYQTWAAGGLSRGTLRNYAVQYYHFESNFPRYVAGAYTQVADPVGRRSLLDNLIDEAGRPPTHPELWLRFARSLGLSRGTVTNSDPSPATKKLCSIYERLTLDGSAASALGALYAYESIFPEVAAEKARGLREQYGIRAPDGLEFFRIHTLADRAHSRAERRALATEIRRVPSALRDAGQAVRETLDGWWRFLDAFDSAR